MTKNEYFEQKDFYDGELFRIDREREEIENAINALEMQKKQNSALRSDAESIRANRALTVEMMDRLVDRIEVTKDKQVRVDFKFVKEFERIQEVTSPWKAM